MSNNPESLIQESSKGSKAELVVSPEDQSFIEANCERLADLRQLFFTENYRDFLKIRESLVVLAKDYIIANKNTRRELSPAILREIVGDEYIYNQEQHMTTLPQESGLYLPDGAVGGDFWSRSDESGAVGQFSSSRTRVEMADAGGHGLEAFYGKAFGLRFLELYKKSPQFDRERLFIEFDLFAEDLPLKGYFDYLTADLDRAESGVEFRIEASGSMKVFLRRHRSGYVLLGMPATVLSSVDPEDFVQGFELATHIQLGTGVVGNQPYYEIEPIYIDEDTDVYLMSDGLFGAKVEAETIEQRFSEWCQKRRDLSSDEFREQFCQMARSVEAACPDKYKDDVTILVLPVVI